MFIITCEYPLHAVLKDPLLISCHRPHAESVDICSIVDIVQEILFGVDFVIIIELELKFSVETRVETWAGVLAVQHEELLKPVLVVEEVPPDEAERMLELGDPAALQDDKELGVKLLGKHLIIDVGKDINSGAVILSSGLAHHLDIVEACQLFKRVGAVVIDNKVLHAFHRDPSFHLDDGSCLLSDVAVFHDEADALLPPSEEGEAHDEVGGLDEAVVGQEVLV